MLPSDITNKKIIVAPLDWGLGHATRCIPLIRQFLEQDNAIVFAGVSAQIELLKKDFPGLFFEKIPGYDISLSSEDSTYRQMLAQYRKMKGMVWQEQGLANELVKVHKADVILSDNRYGFHADKVFNIFMTHQLNPQLPLFQSSVRRLLAKYIMAFDCCWVPDEKELNLCGKLTRANMDIPIYYIGLLSRFKYENVPAEREFLVIVSGPEPERTRFQTAVYEALKRSKKTHCIVSPNRLMEDKVVVNPSSSELEKLINSSEKVISRAGYTTIMELLEMNKPSILIPTKGQYEQEYLATHIQHPLLTFLDENEAFLTL